MRTLDYNKTSVERFITTWLEYFKKPDLKPRAYDSLESTIKTHIIPTLGKLQVGAITPEEIQGLLNDLQREGKSYSTIKKVYDAINACFKWGVVGRKIPFNHVHNGTYDTALQLTGFDPTLAHIRNYDFADAGKKTLFYTKIIPSMVDYYETTHYIFVHGWIPCITDRRTGFGYYSDWRNVDPFEWKRARWYNGMNAVQTCMEDKTILCGHWHSSYGHWKYEHIGSEFGEDADFSPYYGSGIIALDACTAISNRVNVIVLEDNPI